MNGKILQGDCIEVLRTLADESVYCCVTSPPYWGLRDYGVGGQIGLEKTPDEFVARMVDVFREVRRVLRKDGTLWLNLGDGYAQGGSGGASPKSTLRGSGVKPHEKLAQLQSKSFSRRAPDGLKPKDLVGIPWRVAFALQADGWYLRQEIIWHKPAPMPESIKDRCTKAHEHIFLLAKSDRYYFDQSAISEPCSENTHARLSQSVEKRAGSLRAHGGVRSDRPMKAVAGKLVEPGAGIKSNVDFAAATAGRVMVRNKRTVWTVPSEPYSGAHFATFPPELIRPCILAGAPRDGVVLDPFFGAGTTGLVCIEEGREYIGIELNPAYIKIAEDRLAGVHYQPKLFEPPPATVATEEQQILFRGPS